MGIVRHRTPMECLTELDGEVFGLNLRYALQFAAEEKGIEQGRALHWLSDQIPNAPVAWLQKVMVAEGEMSIDMSRAKEVATTLGLSVARLTEDVSDNEGREEHVRAMFAGASGEPSPATDVTQEEKSEDDDEENETISPDVPDRESDTDGESDTSPEGESVVAVVTELEEESSADTGNDEGLTWSDDGTQVTIGKTKVDLLNSDHALEVGARIRAIIENKGRKPMEVLVEALGVTQGASRTILSWFEKGKGNLKRPEIKKLADALDVPVVDFLRGRVPLHSKRVARAKAGEAAMQALYRVQVLDPATELAEGFDLRTVLHSGGLDGVDWRDIFFKKTVSGAAAVTDLESTAKAINVYPPEIRKDLVARLLQMVEESEVSDEE